MAECHVQPREANKENPPSKLAHWKQRIALNQTRSAALRAPVGGRKPPLMLEAKDKPLATAPVAAAGAGATSSDCVARRRLAALSALPGKSMCHGAVGAGWSCKTKRLTKKSACRCDFAVRLHEGPQRGHSRQASCVLNFVAESVAAALRCWAGGNRQTFVILGPRVFSVTVNAWKRAQRCVLHLLPPAASIIQGAPGRLCVLQGHYRSSSSQE